MARNQDPAGSRDAFDAAPGPRQLDLAGLDPGVFEEIAHRLVRVTYPTSRHTGNPDSGADTLLPKEGERGWDRAWQARRYSTDDSHWKSCEQALDKAVDSYGVTHYTFVFPKNLGDKATLSFDGRLKTRHNGVAVDYWDLSELLAQLDETVAGRRIGRSFFGPSREEFEQGWLAAVASGNAQLETAGDVMDRLRALATWLEINDPHYAYETHTWNAGQDEAARNPGIVMSHYDIDERTGQRIDARLHDDADTDRLPSLTVEFDPTEAGRAASEAILDAERRNVSAVVTDGITVKMEGLPGLWVDQNGEPMRPTELHVIPTLPNDLEPIDALVRAVTPDGPVTLDVTIEPVLVEGWHQTWRGTESGMTIEVAMRPRQDGQEGTEAKLHLTYALPGGVAARQALPGAQFAEAASRATNVDVVPPDGDAMRFDTDPAPADGLRNLVTVIDAAVTVEEWTGERIPMPERFADDGTIGALLAAAATIRAGGQQGRAAGMRCTLADGADIPEKGPLGITMVLQEEVGYEIAGRVVWLGCIAWLVSNVAWTVETDADGRTVLVASDDEATPVIGMLHRGKLTDLPVPDDFESFDLHRD
jgi:hypothetical protein